MKVREKSENIRTKKEEIANTHRQSRSNKSIVL